ncbi:RagB/SusD family nutrient uptake outer membrane protein [Chitinophaga cymbidii]|uniref:Membrane protein n=1 Tax=Chitinophaga cymbidii TaxID=1096750 RepID=A0A512RQ12_9BACT|nr:RagB/SusD family nutrient uptake outer membrane protein [Chitinophaga cymbidii]GEP97782.1 membrane protein [Chitinophaga cymbidii]
MSYIKKNLPTLIILWLALIISSCSKILDEKPDRSITTISNIKDLLAILRDYDRINNFGASLADIGVDEYALSSSAYANLDVESQNACRWDKDTKIDAWTSPYIVIYYANLVLQGLEQTEDGSSSERDNARGQALFFRAFAFYQLAQIYCKPYSESAQTDLGIPLRITPNVEEKIARSTVSETYARIIKDAEGAIALMPMDNDAINVPDKLVCFGFLARVYLSMRDYTNAEKYASLYLSESPDLIDFNTLDTLANPSFSTDNTESVFLAFYGGSRIPAPSTTVNPFLFNSYNENDLRRKVLFIVNHDGSVNYKGSYEGREGYVGYCGIATNEIYLIRAECLVRRDMIDGGLADLNRLLSHRYIDEKFIPETAASKEDALELVLHERWKELLFRSSKWSDLRRLNLEGANISLQREIDGITYTLPPNDKRWVWLIPDEVIRLSGIQQNER